MRIATGEDSGAGRVRQDLDGTGDQWEVLCRVVLCCLQCTKARCSWSQGECTGAAEREDTRVEAGCYIEIDNLPLGNWSKILSQEK